MMKYSSLGFAAAMCVILAACVDSTGPRTVLVTRIDRAVLDSAGSLNVSFTITNVGREPEDVPACGGQPVPNVQRLQARRWEEFAGGLCLAIYSMVPVSLQPGASISGTTNVFQAGPGIYRLVVSNQRVAVNRDPLAPPTYIRSALCLASSCSALPLLPLVLRSTSGGASSAVCTQTPSSSPSS